MEGSNEGEHRGRQLGLVCDGEAVGVGVEVLGEAAGEGEGGDLRWRG